MGEMERIIGEMGPGEAVAETTGALRKLLPLLDEDERIRFFMDLVGEAGGENVASMVHL